MKIGRFHFDQVVAAAPMAGVSDRPFRILARRFGADYAVSEMIAADTRLWRTRKTRSRLDMHDEAAPRIVQIAGAEPHHLADAARAAQAAGADIIDINMGCPAKKVCNRLAGSALLRDEALVGSILAAVVGAVDVPVTLKTRTGWDREHRNGVRIASLAEDCGIAAISVHGRTRECAFRGAAEYQTIAAIKAAIKIPVIANGDIGDAATARRVLTETGADGVMVGRAAHGNPWLFAAIKAELSARPWQPPSLAERAQVMREHVEMLYRHYGCEAGLRIARKHVGWYLEHLPHGRALRGEFNRLATVVAQTQFLHTCLARPALELAA